MRAAVALFPVLISMMGRTTGPEPVDVLRIKEAFRLTEAVQDSVWPGGWGAVPFPLLLVTEEREFLVAFPRTPSGFANASNLDSLGTRVLERPRQLQPNLLATFPAFGPPSAIVVGRPEATGKTSTTWILTIVHERFHQFQTADLDYYSAVERLDLSGGDQTGMWMLNYPFPYRANVVVERFASLSRNLARLLNQSDQSSASERRSFWRTYRSFLGDLSGRDRRYLSFQVWQEGIARYVELRAAEFAARRYDPTAGFEALPDFQVFADIAPQMRATILEDLANPDLPARRRASFYAFGAGLALLLDKDVPNWKSRYLTEKFSVERYIDPAG